MKAAKSAVCLFITFLIFGLILSAYLRAPVTASADSPRYARADSRDIYFCDKKDLNSALFAIPYTYCVEILSTDGEWYYVKYAADSAPYRALYGFCLKEKLTPVSDPPENIYLNMPVTVTFKTDAPAGSLPVLNELNVTAAFYGTYRSGATDYSYVLYDGNFGYIYGANDNYPLNEIYEEPPTEELPTESKGANTTLIVALVLAGLAAAALIILYFSGKRKYRPEGQ